MLPRLDTSWEDDDEQQPKAKDIFHEQVFDMWEAGIRDLNEIRQETGYTTRYIRQLLRERGYTVNNTIPRTVDEMNQIVLDYRMMSVRAVLKKWKISNNTLYAVLEERGEPIKRNNNKVRNQHIERAVQMYLERAPIKEITVETGIHAPTLYEALQERGIATRYHDAMPNLSLDKAIEMYNMGATVIDIMVETGINTTSLYKALSERSISKRRGSDFDVRLNRAVELYLEKKPATHIYAETKIGAPVLYRALRERNIQVRQGKAQGDLQLAVQMYDQGKSFREIHGTAKVTLGELLSALRKRGGNLRTGLSVAVTPSHLRLAVDMYRANKSVDDIELDTFVGRTMLYAELKKKQIAIRP
jgi:DNA-binding phage protein